ncbi:MAG TPA: transporter substrate-binding domain-containing protein [Pseudonocardiaceae bacterium]
MCRARRAGLVRGWVWHYRTWCHCHRHPRWGTPFDGIQSGADLNAGKCDLVAAGMAITKVREQNFDFSAPYFDATQVLVARRSGVTGFERSRVSGSPCRTAPRVRNTPMRTRVMSNWSS